MTMPDAVRFVSSDDEWHEFEQWLAKPKPFMLDKNGKCPDVPHDLADELFARLITRLKKSELIAFGSWGQRPEFIEIDPMHWSTLHFNIWFNELGYADEGRAGFSAIYVEERHATRPAPSKPAVRQAVKRVLAEWRDANPDAQITKPNMLAFVRDQLGQEYEVSDRLFTGIWLTDIPRLNKFSNRPPG